jgi:hypothetical protein
MSDVGNVDSLLDSLMDDAEGVSFGVVGDESASRTPSPAIQARAMGVRSGVQGLVGVGGTTSRMQGTMSSGKAYSIVRVAGSDRSVCFGKVVAHFVSERTVASVPMRMTRYRSRGWRKHAILSVVVGRETLLSTRSQV